MNEIKIENNLIKYICKYNRGEYEGSWVRNKDQSWRINIDLVQLIGGINRMCGDNDSYFIVFIDNNLKKYFLNITYDIDGIQALNKLFEERFKIKLREWSVDFYDNEKIIYPQKMTEYKLYRKSLKSTLRRILMIDHEADGELSDIIKSIRK